MTPLSGPEPGLGWLSRVPLEVTFEVGRVTATVADVLALRPGSTLALGRADAVEVGVFVEGRLLAFAEAVAVDDQLGVRITDLSRPPGTRQRA